MKRGKDRRSAENYLDRIPVRACEDWSADDAGAVTLAIHNKGVFHFVAQKLFGKPRISYVHLDETGSFIWPLLDGEHSVYDVAQLVEKEFGEKAQPLYPRVVKFFQILESYGFVELRRTSGEK